MKKKKKIKKNFLKNFLNLKKFGVHQALIQVKKNLCKSS
jgi:hypothetical protein